MRSRNIALATAVLSVAWCGRAWADDAKEQSLQQKVDELQRQLDDLSKRVGDGTNRAGDELSARMDELEKVTKKDKDGVFPYFSGGLKMDSANGAFKFHVGGRIQSDWTMFQHTYAAEEFTGKKIEAGEEFRRARLAIDGTMYNNIIFSAEYDFAGGAAVPRDVWLGVKGLPFGQVQVGNIKEPTGTEELTTDLYTPFMERSAANSAFAPDYKAGFMASDNIGGDDWCWEAGVFRNSAASGNSTGNTHSGEYNYDGRIAGRPFKNDDGTQYVTCGLAVSFRNPMNDSIGFKSSPELHLAPAFVDTGTQHFNKERLIELDGGYVAGPFWAFADGFSVRCQEHDNGANDVTFDGWQVAAGWFLTGETKPYKTSNATYDRIKPKSNFDGKGGTGAWEIAARVSELNLNDGDISGGKMDMFTLGVSWYLNPNTRFMLDWVHANHSKMRDVSFWINALEARFQVDF